MKKSPLRKHSKNPISKLKKKADAAFSIHIRMKGAAYPVKLLQWGIFVVHRLAIDH